MRCIGNAWSDFQQLRLCRALADVAPSSKHRDVVAHPPHQTSVQQQPNSHPLIKPHPLQPQPQPQPPPSSSQIDKLQTNNQGVFVLRDTKFRWLAPFTADDDATRRAAATVLNFPCGLIKGALENLGITSTVQAEVRPKSGFQRVAVKAVLAASEEGPRVLLGRFLL